METKTELLKSLDKSEFLKKQITAKEMESFFHKLQLATTTLPPFRDDLRSLVRDPSDDYLINYAILHDVDYLITGDPDLLTLRTVGSVRIINPVDFMRLVRQSDTK
jgi:putative PIN family toxin of toxin-antitoxin system